MFVPVLKEFIDSNAVSTQNAENLALIVTQSYLEPIMKFMGTHTIFIIFTLCLLWMVGPAQAEHMYISDTIKITLRSGPGTDHKILHMVTIGDPVKRIRAEKDWSLVRVDGETEGWVLNRFLSPEVPKNVRLRRLEKKYTALENFSKNPIQENARLKKENLALSSQVTDLEEKLEQLHTDHETLKTEAADFLSLKAAHKRTVDRFSKQTEEFERMDEALSEIQKQQIFRWFLSGAGVLLLGFIIGMGTRKKSRRYSL